jgi:hypothetical protein
MEEEQDPQDTAVLSNDMAEPKPEQETIRVKSVYEGLVRIAMTHGKLYRTNGRKADMLKFDLTAHSVFAGNAFIVHNGTLKMTVLETATAKIDLACRCEKLGIPLIASMGTGNKLDPTRFEVADIYDTSVDPLARVMRKKLKEHGVRGLKVVYSKEQPLSVSQPGENPDGTPRRAVPGSVSFVPSVAGLIIAGEVVKDILGIKQA